MKLLHKYTAQKQRRRADPPVTSCKKVVAQNRKTKCMNCLPKHPDTKQSHYLKKKKFQSPRMPQWAKNLLISRVKCICNWHSHINNVWWFYFMSTVLKIMRHRSQMSHRHFIYPWVKHFPLRRNISLIKSSLLHISVVKKNPAHYPSFISVYLRILMASAVSIFNKLD